MKAIKEFFHLESASGVCLIFATLAALVCSNTGLKIFYDQFLTTNLAIIIGEFALKKPILLWVNEGLMAVFFFLVGLELKREFLIGHLSKKEQVLLPGLGAIGGILGPALVFYWITKEYPEYVRGWAIPAATDIAFALAVLGMCSRNVPSSAKVFLMTLAIFDDLAAVIIIALFYTNNISMSALLFASIAILGLVVTNRMKINRIAIYLTIGSLLWMSVLQSGIHATLAGFIIALFIPMGEKFEELEKSLEPWVAFLILPLFAFCNTGIDLSLLSLGGHASEISMGVASGLFFGKQFGIFSMCLLGIYVFKFKIPSKMNLISLYGVCTLGGIGFTMSLFISSLAYEYINVNYILQARLGTLIGSIASGVLGFIIVKYSFDCKQSKSQQN